uniref:Uncharacterized protein n=1 Tax=Romanomermis culicivorax TaxID=13658 RepID=A0A915JH42_ROMCU
EERQVRPGVEITACSNSVGRIAVVSCINLQHFGMLEPFIVVTLKKPHLKIYKIVEYTSDNIELFAHAKFENSTTIFQVKPAFTADNGDSTYRPLVPGKQYESADN